MSETCQPADCPSRTSLPGALDQDGEIELAELAKALGHPARIRILRLLLERNTCVCGDIVDELPLAQSTVSQHLKQLREAGLIQGEIDGPRRCYCIDHARMRRMRMLMAAL